ncbi:unnamed protein product [Prunus armeniaca]
MSFRRKVIWARSSASAVRCIMGELLNEVLGGNAGLALLYLPNGNPSSDKNVGTEVVPMCSGENGSILFVSHRRRQTVDA